MNTENFLSEVPGFAQHSWVTLYQILPGHVDLLEKKEHGC